MNNLDKLKQFLETLKSEGKTFIPVTSVLAVIEKIEGEGTSKEFYGKSITDHIKDNPSMVTHTYAYNEDKREYESVSEEYSRLVKESVVNSVERKFTDWSDFNNYCHACSIHPISMMGRAMAHNVGEFDSSKESWDDYVDRNMDNA